MAFPNNEVDGPNDPDVIKLNASDINGETFNRKDKLRIITTGITPEKLLGGVIEVQENNNPEEIGEVTIDQNKLRNETSKEDIIKLFTSLSNNKICWQILGINKDNKCTVRFYDTKSHLVITLKNIDCSLFEKDKTIINREPETTLNKDPKVYELSSYVANGRKKTLSDEEVRRLANKLLSEGIGHIS